MEDNQKNVVCVWFPGHQPESAELPKEHTFPIPTLIKDEVASNQTH
jgi:hypothetical protein